MEDGRDQAPLREGGKARDSLIFNSQVDFKSTVVGVWDEGKGGKD